MVQITTSTRTDVAQWPSSRRLERGHTTGHLWFTMLNAAGTSVLFFRSTDNGGSWSQFSSWTPGTTILELSSVLLDVKDRIYWAYRTNESGQDRVYFMAAVINSTGLSLHSLLRLTAVTNGGTAGSVYQGLSLAPIRFSDGRSVVAVAAGTTSGAQHGAELFGVSIPAIGQPALNNGLIAGKRKWLVTGSGRITPSLVIERYPMHLWLTFGRTSVNVVRLPWSGASWTGPTTAQQLLTGVPAQDWLASLWSEGPWSCAVPYPTDTTRVVLLERNPSNTKTWSYISEVHPTGAVRHCTLSLNNVTQDVRVYAVGTSTGVLYYCDFIRATLTWSGWSQVSATAILGTNADNYQVRRESQYRSKFDVVTAHAGSPNTVVHTAQALTYAPFAPTWVVGSTANSPETEGAAVNVGNPLDLVWKFSDPDSADTQSAWALSRQIGTGTLAYFRASDSTWQATEQKNVGTTSSRTLAAGWGSATDANYTYRVKVWDSTDTASVYSPALVVVPSTPVTPTITSPADSAVLTQDSVTVTWTVAEQTAYRVVLRVFTDVVYDSGWRAGSDTSFTPDYRLSDGFFYGIDLYTRNNERLPAGPTTVIVSVDYVEPAPPTMTVTPMPTLGVIRVVITNPPPSVMNANPYFESTASPWTAVGGTVARSTAQFHQGVASLLFTPDGVTADVDARSENVPVTVGQTYRASAWVRSAVARSIGININWRNSGGGFLALSTTTVALAAGTWTLLEVTATAPAGAVTALLTLAMGSTPPASNTLHIDEAELKLDVPAVLFNDLLRRDEGAGLDFSSMVTVARGLPTGATYDDWTVRSGKGYEYRVEARGANGTTGFSPTWQA